MDKELKREVIIKTIKEIEEENFINFLFGFATTYNRSKVKAKESKHER